MKNHKFYKLTKFKVFVLLLIVLFGLPAQSSPLKTYVSAQEINRYLNPTAQITNVTHINNLPNENQPLTASEIAELNRLQQEQKKVAEEKLYKEKFGDKAKAIDNYLRSKKSPLAGNGIKIAELEVKYGVSAKLVIAIAGKESGFCKINFRPYNCWGWMTKKIYSSYSEILDAYFNYIRTQYIDKGLTTPVLMAKKYCPPTYAEWAAGVNKFISGMNW